MGSDWGFQLIFKSEEASKVPDLFLELILPYLDNNPLVPDEEKQPRKVKNDGYYGYYPLWVKLTNEDSDYRTVGFGLTPFKLNNEYVSFHFTTDISRAMSTGFEMVTDIFLAIAPKLDPVAGFWHSDFLATSAESPCEYYRNPYLFCIVPRVDLGNLNTRQAIDYYPYLKDKTLESKLAGLRTALSKDELIRILEQHCDKVVVGVEGVGVYKGKLRNEQEFILTPRQFIRQELRRRGVKLEESLVEMLEGRKLKTVEIGTLLKQNAEQYRSA